MQINKIKISFKKDSMKNELGSNNFLSIKIVYKKQSNEMMDEITSTSSDMPSVSFFKEWNKLCPFVLDVCEFNGDPAEIRVTGLSLSYGGDNNNMGCVITAQKDLAESSAPLNLNTPHKIEEFYSEHGDPKSLMPPGLAALCKTIINHTKDYLNGKRAQGKLFNDENK